MAIDRSGTWWIDENAADVEEYLRQYTADGYPADEFRQCACGKCGGRLFGLRVIPTRVRFGATNMS
jgi:hypothetical protein